MPCLAFAMIYVAARESHWGTLIRIGLIAYVIGRMTRQPLEQLPVRMLINCIGAASAAP